MTDIDSSIIYKQLVEHMNEAVWMGDADECTVYANPKFCELVGYTLEEMLGRKSYDFWDEKSARRVQHVNTSLRKKGVSSSYEGTLKTKEGALIPVLLSGTTLPDDGTIGIMTDLRGLKQKEEQEHILGSAVAQASDAIIIVDEKGYIKFWNRGASILFGYAESTIIGKPISTIVDSDISLKELREQSDTGQTEIQGKHKNGIVLPITIRITPAPSSVDKKRWLFIARDISFQRKFEQELELKYEKLRAAYNQFGIIRRQMDYTFELAEMTSHAQSVTELGNYIVNAVMMLTRADACVLRLYDKDTKQLKLLSSFGLGQDWNGKTTLPFTGSLAERAFRLGKSLRIIDLAQEPHYSSVALAKKHDLSSLLFLPLIMNDKLLGTLSLYVKPARKLELFENEFIQKFTHIISLVLQTTMQRDQ